MRINQTENNIGFKNISALAKPLNAFYNANATIPTLVIESGVTLGRTGEAYKESGKIEATERLIEQGAGAIIWVYGVQLLKKIGEAIGKKALKVDNFNFDIGFDYLRNPLENLDKKIVNFKAGNLLASTAIMTMFIGFGLPKINNFITDKMRKKEKNENSILKPISFKEFQKTTKGNKNISFTSAFSENLKSFANILENNSAARLLITDVGVVSGRCHNAKGKERKIEYLFRDLASIYFYLFSTKNIVSLLNKLTNNTNIDPKTLDVTVDMLNKNIKKSNTKTNVHNFLSKTIGSGKFGELNKIDELFSNKKVISLEEFLNAFPKYKDKATIMSELQPLLHGRSILSKKEAQDIVQNGWVSNPKFLKQVFEKATDGKYKNKNNFVSASKIDKIRNSIDGFIHQIQKTAEKKNLEIDENLINRIAKNNIRKNFAFNVIGTGISIFALGILIPKIQYIMREKLTKHNESK